MQQFLSAVHGGQFGQVINNYYAATDCWQALPTPELHDAIKITKQKRRLARWNKWTNPTVMIGVLCTLLAVLVLGGNILYLFADYTRLSNHDNTFSYIAIVFMLISIFCYRLSENQTRREKIFIERCNYVIDICEQIIHERQYD